MRNLAIENCAKLMAKAYMNGNDQAVVQYINKLQLITDRDDMSNASVIKELCNQRVDW